MRISLRWKIMLLTVLTPATLAAATLFTVNRNVAEHVNSSSIHENLEHSVAVFEGMLDTRMHALLGGSRVIAQDPRFFSLLMLGPTQHDSRFIVTVRGMARDFSRITQTDLFEVLDRNGRLLASVGTASSTKASRESQVREALKGRTVESILVGNEGHYQVAVTPVLADGRIVGVLMLGARIDQGLAQQLRSQMLCEVTFLSGTSITGTTLRARGDQGALVRAVRVLGLGPDTDLRKLGVQKVLAHTLYLTLVRRIPLSDPHSQQLYVLQRAFDPESSFLRVMQRDMLNLTIIALILALVTGLLFSEQILRPLQSLVRGAQEMEKGNYDHPLRVRRRDEIGYLADRFVDMRRRERAYLSSLQQAGQVKSNFLSVASHELRTPISVLIGYRDLLADGKLGPLTPRQQEALEAMSTSLIRLTRVAEDSARFAQVQSQRLALNFRPCEVEPVLRRAVGSARSEGTGRDVKIEMKCDPMSGPVDADGESLAQAIQHLITNGIRFTPDGGHVQIHSREVSGMLRVEVKDNGVGIPEERLNALLSQGAAAAEASAPRSGVGLEFNLSGLGFGLSIAKAIVEGHGGTLSAGSRVGEGSTFLIEIPMRHTSEVHAAA